MGDEAAEEWLAVAATAVADLPEDILALAATEARKTCTHHGQIVPAVLKEGNELLAWRRARQPIQRIPAERRIEQQPWRPEDGEIERIKREAAERLSVGR